MGLEEPAWKCWLDRALIFNTFVVITGAIWFVVAVVALVYHIEQPMLLFRLLWSPLFAPTISVLILSSLFSGLWVWWQQRGH